MSGEDKLPVLAFPSRKDATNPPPAKLEQAIAAMRAALENRPAIDRSAPATVTQDIPDSFSPVGVPRSKPEVPRRGSGREAIVLGQDAAAPTKDSLPIPARDHTVRRITAIHLPRFAMERWLRWAAQNTLAPPDDLPVVLAVEGTHGPVVHATNRAAQLQGIHIGARVVDMRALCPDLRVEFADIGGDRVALEKLMIWARRWCPWTATDGATGLVLDTSGSDHLLGGEAAMLREIETRLSTLGLSASLATAPTHGAAWAMARFGGVRRICSAQDFAAQLSPLPVRALRLDGDTVVLLQRLGLKTVGDLAAVPRVSLARRFARAPLAKNPLLRLDQMMGHLGEPVSSPDDPPRFATQSALAEPVQDPEPHLPALCDTLCTDLFAAGFGARRVTLTVFRTDGEVSQISVATSQPSRDPDHIRRLFDGKLERIDPGFGFDLITLAAAVAENLPTVQTRLEGGADNGAELGRMIDRLSAKFGAGAVRRPTLRDSHIPERREGWQPAMAGEIVPPAPLRTLRPIRLLDPPEEVRVLYGVPEGPPAQFVWRRVTHRVTRFAGPERIAPEWWADRPGTRLRDYYRIEDHTGCRFWLYREGLHGDGRGGDPRWMIHGVFA
ncbi:MAG: DNA polymerase Y family protein [Octadecabacter sp.]